MRLTAVSDNEVADFQNCSEDEFLRMMAELADKHGFDTDSGDSSGSEDEAYRFKKYNSNMKQLEKFSDEYQARKDA
tara:strand:- start:1621 stop:1848 length:228 start_codon:yes stop_codon:yes gene_type:complete